MIGIEMRREEGRSGKRTDVVMLLRVLLWEGL